MAGDIYSRQGSVIAGAFSAEDTTLSFAGVGSDGFSLAGGVGLLTQSLQVSYSQNVTRLYEVGSPNSYLIAGRTQGQASLSRIIGPRAIQAAFYRKFGNVCNARSNNIDLAARMGCNGDNSGSLYSLAIGGCVLTSVSISVSAQDMMINESLQMIFISLEIV